MSKNLPFFILVFVIVVWLKIFNNIATNDELLFLLQPTNFFIEIWSGEYSFYLDGYNFETLGIVINRSCSGINFFIISFSLFAISSFFYCHKIWQKIFMIFVALSIAYFVTIFATVSRILVYLVIYPAKYYLPSIATENFHQLEGSFIYLFLLVGFYLILDKILKRCQNE